MQKCHNSEKMKQTRLIDGGGDMTSDNATVAPELVKQLLALHQIDGQTKRIPTETAKATSELLRLFIVEAQSRASVEAECDDEGGMLDDDTKGGNIVPIRAEHITKIAAELMMDFS